MRLTLTALPLIALASTANAEDRPSAKWRETEQIFLANSGPRGTVTYDEDDYILRVPLVWSVAVRLENTIDFDVNGESETIEAGRVLPRVTFSANGEGDDAIDVYCTPRNAAERSLEGGLMGAMFGGVGTRAITKGLSDSQRCLVDTDGDGAFDKMLVVGEGPGNYRWGDDIEPIAYTVEKHLPISEADDEVRIQIDSIGRRRSTFELEIIQQGRERNFDTIAWGDYSAPDRARIPTDEELPLRATLYGVEFEIISRDRRAKTITIHWPEDADFEAAPAIPANYQVTYLPY